MKLARVTGTVVSTINVPVFDGRTLLLCDLLSPEGVASGGYLIAVDTVGAGVGETVLLLDEGNGARQILGAKDAPVRTLVVGIVDAVELVAGAAATPPVVRPAAVGRRAARAKSEGPKPARPRPARPNRR